MGQTSSTNSKSAIPATNLIVDASDSYITDLKLRSTAVIPISEYIKKDKYGKNSQKLQQIKRSKVKQNKSNEKQSKVETTTEKESLKILEKNISDQKRKEYSKLKLQKKLFLESSYEDIPIKRKWINNESQLKVASNESIRRTRTQSKTQEHDRKLSSKTVTVPNQNSDEDLRQLYKNNVYPHIYKNKFLRNAKLKQEKEEKSAILTENKSYKQEKKEEKPITPPENNTDIQKKKEEQLSTPMNSKTVQYKQDKKKDRSALSIKNSMYFSDTSIKKPEKKFEQSTHQLNEHNVNNRRNLRNVSKSKNDNLSVQTNIACIIHPERNKQLQKTVSDETLSKKYNPSVRNDYNPSEESMIRNKTNRLLQISKEHRRQLSGKHALETWKNIHTLKHHRKLNNISSDEDTNNYNYIDTKSHKHELVYDVPEYGADNYYLKHSPDAEMDYINPKEMKYLPSKATFDRPPTPRYDYMENTYYERPPSQSKYQENFENRNYGNSHEYNRLERNLDKNLNRNINKNPEKIFDRYIDRFPEKNFEKYIDRYPEKIIERNPDKSFDRNPDKSFDRNPDKSFDRNPDKSFDRNPDKSFDRNPDKSFDRNISRNTGRNIDRNPDKKFDRSSKKGFDRNPEKDFDRNPEKDFDRSISRNVERNPDKKINRNSEKKIDRNLQKDFDRHATRHTDRHTERKFDRNPEKKIDRNVNRNPEKDFDRNPEKDFERNPEKNFDRNPEKNFDRTPEKDFDRNPEKDFDRNPEKDYDRNIRKSDKSIDRNIARNIRRNIRNIDRNMEKTMEREDFVTNMERCLQRRHYLAAIYGRGYNTGPSKSTWVQDKYRRWHKVTLDQK